MPETIPKQEKLARQIDGQVSIWAELALSPRHPSARHVRFVDLIIGACTPQDDDPETVVAKHRFQQQLQPDLAALDIHAEKRRAAIAKVAQIDALDLQPVHNELFKHWFEVAESYQETYQTSPGYPLALQYMKRLFIMRERLASAPSMPHIDGIDTHEFGVVLRTLIEEL